MSSPKHVFEVKNLENDIDWSRNSMEMNEDGSSCQEDDNSENVEDPKEMSLEEMKKTGGELKQVE